MHKFFIYLSIYFCLTCFGLPISPSSEAGVPYKFGSGKVSWVWRQRTFVVWCQVELITRTEESYRLWRVVVCDQGTSWYEDALARAGLQSQI
jgi:hypothetical protein